MPKSEELHTDPAAMLEGLRHELTRLSSQVQSYVEDKAASFKEGAADAADNVETLIRDNPLPALGIALGTGLVAGLILRSGLSRSANRYPGTREMERALADFRSSLEGASRRVQQATGGPTDSAFMERLGGLLAGLLDASQSTASSVATAGERAAKNVASIGERTARSIADRLSTVNR